jgi:hypothetical protein
MESTPVYAVVVNVQVDPDAGEESITAVDAGVIPRVRQAPGAIAGHWLAPDAQGRGMSIIFFETREQAEAMVPMVPLHPAPGVTRVSVEVRQRFTGF